MRAWRLQHESSIGLDAECTTACHFEIGSFVAVAIKAPMIVVAPQLLTGNHLLPGARSQKCKLIRQRSYVDRAGKCQLMSQWYD